MRSLELTVRTHRLLPHWGKQPGATRAARVRISLDPLRIETWSKEIGRDEAGEPIAGWRGAELSDYLGQIRYEDIIEELARLQLAGGTTDAQP